MQHELNHIVQSLLGRRHLEEITGDHLAELVREHPYSAVLHLLYSKKLQQSKDPRFAESVARTALYFSNPHWLHHLLRPKTGAETTRALEQAFELKRKEIADQVAEFPASESDTQPVPPAMEALDASAEIAETTAIESAGEAESEAMIAPEITASPSSLPETEVLSESLGPVTHPETTEGPVTADVDIDLSSAPVAEETEGPRSGIPAAPLAPPETALIPLEPLYTIDYFASQGIQLSEDEKQDPLGKKLKSFTEWLRTMKKVHPDKNRLGLDEKAEDNIKATAEHSNEQSEVVTEAMAEVFLKQGLKHKALAVYQKLSLLNPGQSASFAAKIADLNATES